MLAFQNMAVFWSDDFHFFYKEETILATSNFIKMHKMKIDATAFEINQNP
jgi:hypothetical protein